MYTDKVPEWDEKEIISTLSDIRAQYSIFDLDERPKYHACSCAIDTIRKSHAHWEDCTNGWMCSNCQRDNSRDTKYCPNCGAKMDEKEGKE